MNLWTLTKTTAAVVSVGILMTPVLRRLGYLPQEPAPAPKRVSRAKRPEPVAETPAELSVPAAPSTSESSAGSRRSHH
ncbi:MULTISPECIES: hypothetical protein [Hydrocarboniphaga]|jgi:hypothetical protein|uniref:Uncharacterized protein n=1 Tax=Hydrocarboniphaga effusa AP103 TaxID=1172194 RepID=I8I3J5_9GAMM|nr:MULTISPECIES: hypothetical protein [Hydrocarboniphaga]EIT70616.1 hypothetical protein WQQ_07530 [Hydrocarboniphaga effusa AP103]MDZ4081251.1 hypothetical protein [Hydrocarboniphaga sp.]